MDNNKPKYFTDFKCPHCGGDAVMLGIDPSAYERERGEKHPTRLIWCSAGCVVVEGPSAVGGQELVHDFSNEVRR